MLGLIWQLYDIEDEILLQGPDERRAVRQERSVPVVDRLITYLREQKDTALPKSQYGQAIAYVLNRPEEMRRYTEDGRLQIDNNTSERTLRLIAIGRKNWTFLGSDQGGETAAILFTILANAKRYQIEPFAYVRALLIALSSDQVDLESLLPDVWIAAHPELVLQYRRDEAEAAASASAPSSSTPGKDQRSAGRAAGVAGACLGTQRLRRVVVRVVDENERSPPTRPRLTRAGGRRRTGRSLLAYGGDCHRRRGRERTERQAHALPRPVSWKWQTRRMLAYIFTFRASGPGRRPPALEGRCSRARTVWFYRTDTDGGRGRDDGHIRRDHRWYGKCNVLEHVRRHHRSDDRRADDAGEHVKHVQPERPDVHERLVDIDADDV